MPSFVITGSSRGLGFAWLQLLAKDPANQVFGLARDADALAKKLTAEGLSSVTAMAGDISDIASMQQAAATVSKTTGGKLDVLINNAAHISSASEWTTMGEPDCSPAELDEDFLMSFKVNALGLVHAVTAFLPLVLAHKTGLRKIVNISTGMADIDLIRQFNVAYSSPYSVTKAAANAIIAKYSAVYRDEGVLFLSLSPGYVMTERNLEAKSEPEKAADMGAKFVQYAPHFQRPLTAEESVQAQLQVVLSTKAEVHGGDFISHLGSKQWL